VIDMPLLFLEAPTGLASTAKAEMMAALTEAIDKTYRFPDTRVFLREYDAENVCQDGRVGSDAVKPVAFLEAPELSSTDAKRSLVIEIQDVIARFYANLADVEQTLVLINQYPLENVGWLRRLQSDNPVIVDAVAALNA
jgi:phenylpyruvate tautomerase PptA (4-oxalocrotonate tautomerase family)